MAARGRASASFSGSSGDRERGVPFEPCFNVDRTSHVSFRGSISGFGFAYCDFNRRSVRADVVRSTSAPRSIRAASASGND